MTRARFALECVHCDWRPPQDTPMGVVGAHMETEHPDAPTGPSPLVLVVLCPRCDAAMAHFATHGVEDHFVCEPCHRAAVVRRIAPPPPPMHTPN